MMIFLRRLTTQASYFRCWKHPPWTIGRSKHSNISIAPRYLFIQMLSDLNNIIFEQTLWPSGRMNCRSRLKAARSTAAAASSSARLSQLESGDYFGVPKSRGLARSGACLFSASSRNASPQCSRPGIGHLEQLRRSALSPRCIATGDPENRYLGRR